MYCGEKVVVKWTSCGSGSGNLEGGGNNNNGYKWMNKFRKLDEYTTYNFMVQSCQFTFGDFTAGCLTTSLTELAVLVGENCPWQGDHFKRWLTTKRHGDRRWISVGFIRFLFYFFFFTTRAFFLILKISALIFVTVCLLSWENFWKCGYSLYLALIYHFRSLSCFKPLLFGSVFRI